MSGTPSTLRFIRIISILTSIVGLALFSAGMLVPGTDMTRLAVIGTVLVLSVIPLILFTKITPYSFFSRCDQLLLTIFRTYPTSVDKSQHPHEKARWEVTPIDIFNYQQSYNAVTGHDSSDSRHSQQ